jgi:hypothetical protein
VRIRYRNQTPYVGVRGQIVHIGPDVIVIESDKSGAQVRVPFDNIAELEPLDAGAPAEGEAPTLWPGPDVSSGTASSSLSQYRSSGVRAKWAMALVGIATIALLLEALVVAQGFSLFADLAATTEEDVVRWQVNIDGTNNLYIVAVIASAIAFLAWLSRAVENVPALGGGTPIRSPRGAIGWWFAPIANFFVPYQIVADLWRRMAPSPAAQGIGIIVAWWVLWIGGGIAQRVIGAAAGSVTTVDDFLMLLALMFAAILAQVLAGIVLLRIVWQIEERVRTRVAALSLVSASAPSVPVGSPVPPASAAPATGADQSQQPVLAAPLVDVPRAEGSVAYCPSCGTARISGMRFCAGCGMDLAMAGSGSPTGPIDAGE